MSAPEIIVQIVVAGLSAFGGALAAFLLERRRDREKQQDERYLAARFAHLVILTQYQEFLVLDREYLKPFQHRDDAWRMLPPSIVGSIAVPLNIKELSFLLEGSDPDLLNRLTVGQQQYETIRKVLELREQAHRAFQSRVGDLYAQGERPFEDEEAMARAVGLDVVGNLKSSTKAFFQLSPLAHDLLEANLKDLTRAVKEIFPKKREPRFELRSNLALERVENKPTG